LIATLPFALRAQRISPNEIEKSKKIKYNKNILAGRHTCVCVGPDWGVVEYKKKKKGGKVKDGSDMLVEIASKRTNERKNKNALTKRE
jgi:hypothetical protein